ncbi:methyl-accepting chemotaxis protein [Paenibacillus periandrae]|uniref:methyl-accepting chemotaxis protein n=1 Tax=Paenibacillus periandrae TaxID=1761741 RepID=UPI001F099DB5|nr:methyl-accepting chemotaxis protein [Paenibacillus periandrae]
MSILISKKTISFPALSLKLKLMLGFAGMLVLFLGMALYNLQQVNDIKIQLSQQNDKVELKLMALELKEMVQELNIIASGLEISKKADYIPKYNEKRAIFDKMIKRVGDTATTPEQAKWRSKLISLTVDYTNTFDVAAKLVQENKLTADDLNKNMEYLYNESQTLMGDIFVNVDQFYVAYSKDAENAVANTQQLLNNTVTMMLICSIIVVISSIAIAFLLISSFVKPIKRLQHAVHAMANGDLRNKINSHSKDELGALSNSFDHMTDQVRSMLAHTQEIALSLSEHSKMSQGFSGSTANVNADIVRAIQEISTGAEQQASHSEQSTHIIAELGQEIELISGLSKAVHERSNEAAFNTHTGSNSMEALRSASQISESILDKVHQTMTSLSASSVQINKIVNTITDISQQTNVLSLNAAIEAARAGVHGRGFSVIAEEVRQLSLQTNDSSKSIASIIHSLLAQTKDLELYIEEARKSFILQNGKMNESVEAFQEIRSSMDALSQDINQIQSQIVLAQKKNESLIDSVQIVAAIAQETAAGVEEVTSSSIQQNAAIQQIASQADDMMLLSQKLFNEVNRFQIGNPTLLEHADSSQAGEVLLEEEDVVANLHEWSELENTCPEQEPLSHTAAANENGQNLSENMSMLTAEQLASKSADTVNVDSNKSKVQEEEEDKEKKLITIG